jgi:NAD(P)-dependent dehydrogenase (short-subunit alcohol dehydrogenase family)
MVDEFSRLGHTIFGCARTREQIEELRQMYPKQDFEVVDVASEAGIRAWSQRVLKEHGPPDFVLNNAAIINFKSPLWEVDSQEFSAVVDINIKGVASVIRHFVPSMMARRKGVIVNFISRWATRFEAQMAPYCATKWAVVALTRVLSQELKPQGISVVGLNPGIVRTGMLERYLAGTTGVDASNFPTPAEWAAAAVPYILRLRLTDSGKLRSLPSCRESRTHTQTR